MTVVTQGYLGPGIIVQGYVPQQDDGGDDWWLYNLRLRKRRQQLAMDQVVGTTNGLPIRDFYASFRKSK